MIRTRLLAAIAANTLFAASAAEGAYLAALQDGPAAWIEPFAWAGSSAEFYGHDPRDASAHTPVGLEAADAAVIFLLDSATSGDGALSLGVIFDAPGDGSMGTASVQVGGTVAGASVAVAEESVEFDAATLSGAFRWWDCCTDGFLLDGIASEALLATIEFYSLTGIDTIYAATPDGAGGARFVRLGDGGPGLVTIEGGGVAAVSAEAPVPAAFPLLSAGLAALGAVQLRRRRR